MTLTTTQTVAAMLAVINLLAVPVVAAVAEEHTTPELFAVGIESVPLVIGSSILGCLLKSIYKIQTNGERPCLTHEVLGFVASVIASLLVVGIAYEMLVPMVRLTHSPGVVIFLGGSVGVISDRIVPTIHALASLLYKARTGEEMPK